MKVVEILSKRVKGEEVNYNYIYRLIKTNFNFNSDNKIIVIQAYGIEIERQDICDNKIVNIEREYVKYISPHRHKVQELLKMLYNNNASPIHLIDTIGEYIDNYVFDFDEELIKECSSNS